MGVSVWITASIGKGAGDVVLGVTCHDGRRLNLIVEIKDGAKPPSAQKLTPDEQEFHLNWKGQICVIKNELEAIVLIEDIRKCS